MNGKEMKQRLERLGVRAQKVVYKHDTGVYVADFYVPEMRNAIQPAYRLPEQS